jgi:hypothetical protein
MISEMKLDWVAGPLALLARPRTWWRASWPGLMSAEARAMHDTLRNMDRLRYHLGRGRRARDAGRFEDGAAEARKALAANPQSAWALALLGQCLLRQRDPDLPGARRALEQAHLLEATNGYFVRLLLDVLDAQGDVQGRADLLARAWWRGAPVERWLPEGPPKPRRDTPLERAGVDRDRTTGAPVGTVHAKSWAPARGDLVAGRQAVGA